MSAFVLLCIALGIACTAVGGVFLTFSDFVMRALGRASPASAIEAMQHINETVYRSAFLTTFMLLVPASIGLMLWSQLHPEGGASSMIAAGTWSYLLGTFAVTVFANVPLNKRLAQVGPHSEQAHARWPDYLQRWLRWNHVRTVTSLLAGACLLVAAVRLSAAA